MAELSPGARHILARLLDTATFVPTGFATDFSDIAGAVVTDDGMRIEHVDRHAWVELIAATGKPDDVYAENGERIGRVIGDIHGTPVVRFGD